jgi:hypothetical protein
MDKDKSDMVNKVRILKKMRTELRCARDNLISYKLLCGISDMDTTKTDHAGEYIAYTIYDVNHEIKRIEKTLNVSIGE